MILLCIIIAVGAGITGWGVRGYYEYNRSLVSKLKQRIEMLERELSDSRENSK